MDSVIECGAWKYGDKEGVYRIIYGLEAGHTELYVQWVTGKPEPSAADSEPAIVATAPITELDYYHSETMLENITCGTRSGTWIIEADADDGYKSDTDKDSKYRVVVILKDQPGKYWFRKEHSKPKTD
ncbi:MAG TPA: hypothetical protein VLG68_10840 [Gammaproteobacteria bacterium]|nr:hypothetical protein [Gammaproteobacteria bacterium]